MHRHHVGEGGTIAQMQLRSVEPSRQHDCQIEVEVAMNRHQEEM